MRTLLVLAAPPQGFRTPQEVKRFQDMFDEMCYIVATKHGGSLKGEHGTGRNVASFVEMEWGARLGGARTRLARGCVPSASLALPRCPRNAARLAPPNPASRAGTKAYELMWEIKNLFDPDNVLNPGVLLNRDPLVHVKHLKASPAANPLVNRCIECGFCESNCPSRHVARERASASTPLSASLTRAPSPPLPPGRRDITLTPRQRITVYKEMFRLRGLEGRSPEQVRSRSPLRCPLLLQCAPVPWLVCAGRATQGDGAPV